MTTAAPIISLEVPLTQGKVALVDAEDFERISLHTWYAGFRYNKWYAFTDLPNSKTVGMHIMILGSSDTEMIDHIDGNGLNNTRINLRKCSQSQNQANSKKYNTSNKYKGVNKLPSGKYRARIVINRDEIHLGVFDNQEDAAKVYDIAAQKYFGEYARTNF